MIKPIQASKIGKNFIAATMFTTAVLGTGAVNLAAKAQNTQPQQTEIIDKKEADALKTRVINIEPHQIKHNKKVDKIYIKHCEKDKTIKDKKESLDAIYNVYGPSGAVIEIQRNIDNSMLEQTFNSYLEHFDYFNKKRENALEQINDFKKWQNEVFYNELWQSEQKMYEEEEYPSADKVLNTLDNHINNSKFFSKEDKELYKKGEDYFLSEQKEKDSIDAKTDLIAYKTHILNALAFKTYLVNKYPLPESHIFMYYLNYEFLNGDGKIEP